MSGDVASTTKRQRAEAQAEIDRLTAEFLANGGKVKTEYQDPHCDDWMSENEAAALIGIKPEHLRAARSTGGIWDCPAPPFTYFEGRAAFSRARIMEWIDLYADQVKRGEKRRKTA